ncbi:MAG: ankyrin repeat domain-containing protein [Lentisphaeraceae bacterium]|nr:ankyrin repeat domain-containing protein [Lentisphaeraceae bacterium]
MIRSFLFVFLFSISLSAQVGLDKSNKVHAQLIGDWSVDLEETTKVFEKLMGKDNKRFLSTLPPTLLKLAGLKLSIQAQELIVNDGRRDYPTEIKEVITRGNKLLFQNSEDSNGIKGLEVLENGGLRLITSNREKALFVWQKKINSEEITSNIIKKILSKYNGVDLEIDVTRYVQLKQFDALEKLLKEKPEYANYTKKQNGRTVLHEACRFKRFKYIKLLLEHGANPNAKMAKGSYDSGKSTLHIIAKSFDPQDKEEWKAVIDFFVKKNADLDLQDGNGYTALMESMNYTITLKGAEFAKLLIEEGANTNIIDNDGEDFWHKVCSLGPDESFVKFLKEKKIPLSFKENSRGLTPIDLAVRAKKIEFLKVLIKNDFKINKIKSDGGSILHMAIFDLETMKFLVENIEGIDLEARSKMHGSTIRRAMRAGKVEIVKYLLSKGAKIPQDYDPAKISLRPLNDYPVYKASARGRRHMRITNNGEMLELSCTAEIHEVIKKHLETNKK